MFEVFLILCLVAFSCSLMGSILVLRNQSMLADALSHSVLLGIVLGFFVSHSLDSPLLMMGASLFGVLSVLGIDALHSRKVNHDAATGLIFSFFFALAVILISLFARNVHLDLDMVLMGEVLFAPLHRVEILGLSIPVALFKSALLLFINAAFFAVVYHPLKLFLFDERQARLSGIKVKGLHLLILFLVSLTTVLSFEAIGSMTVIVFLVAPSMVALPWSKSFGQLLFLGLVVALGNVCLGYLLAWTFDLTMSGTCAVVCLLIFCVSHFLKNTLKTKSGK